MAHHPTNDELDEQFELFMKESVSDDSVDLGGSVKCSGVLDSMGRAPHKTTGKKTSAVSVLWWQKESEEDSEETPGKAAAVKCRFIKLKKPQQAVADSQEEAVGSVEAATKPVPKPRRKTLDRLTQLDNMHRADLKVSSRVATAVEQKISDYYSPSVQQRISATIESTHKVKESCPVGSVSVCGTPVESHSIDSDSQDHGDGILRSGRTFRKSLRGSQSIQEEEEEGQQPQEGERGSAPPTSEPVIFSRDSLESEDSVMASGQGQSIAMGLGLGMDTLEEELEKASFFGHLEGGASSTIDYSRLNRDLDSSTTTITPGKAEVAMVGIDQRKCIAMESRLSPASPYYSEDEDFEEEGSGKEVIEEKPERPAMLAKVSLHDSLDSASDLLPLGVDSDLEEELGRNKRAERVLPDQSYGQSGVSDMEALPDAYRQISGSLEDSDHHHHSVSPFRRERSSSSSPGHVSPTVLELCKEKPLPPVSTIEDYGELRVSSDLVAGVQSPAACLQQQHQMDSHDGHQNTSHTVFLKSKYQHDTSQTQETQQPLEKTVENMAGEASPLESRQRLQLDQKENELHTREELPLQHNTELSSLRQENYLLQSKLHIAEEAKNKCRWHLGLCNSLDPLTEKKLQEIQKEVKQQETLIRGYQQENEKLYLQMKALQAQSKLNEEAMFTENQRLVNELTSTKEQLSKSTLPRTVQNIGCVDHIQRITELQRQMEAAQRTDERLIQENQRLKQEKQALEVDLQMMRKDRDLAKAHVVNSSGDRSFELQIVEDRYKEEVCSLKKKLQWYAENQELLDRDAARMRTATAEIHKLTEQVEKLKMEVGKKDNESKLKQRTREAKRIQDLERQVKEMEEILKRRNPNSLTALIYAAANSPALDEGPSQTTVLLERRIRKLEAELESHNDEAKRSLRAMEQQYQRIKLQYEQQISDLEQQLAQKHQDQDLAQSAGVWEAQVHSLQDELEQLKETFQSRENILQEKVHSLQSKPKPEKAPQHSPSRHQQQAETALGVRIERLNQELSAKTRTIQELSRTVERLQRERRNMPPGPSLRLVAKQKLVVPKGPVFAPGEREGTVGEGGETAAFPPTHDEKDYQPKVFTGSHISEVLLENERLRLRLEQLEHKWDEERVALQAATAQAQVELHRFQEWSAEQLSSLKADHQREVERLLTQISVTHSSSKVAELTNQVISQEVMVQHFRDQVKELQTTKDALAVSKLREDTLQSQLTRLLEELKQAKECHSPELRHFTSLERKIHNLELRHARREKELQQVISQTRLVLETEHQSELERWRSLAQGKTRELEVFRLELDSILDVLRELQRQGVVIPPPDQGSSLPFTWRT
ncbi:centrosomal protein of 162 kDa isoform X2 [Esox lucius]|uniref:centrosomal protein of 162 kDa isoform X2 n=1 Tax=Esox lucius TaxID=8010 RepID=UPI001476F585|nr:centrosomal protein of 162 kDa isoform X2 [Esox lucius]